MKTRNGFVSNSSSTSFCIAIKNEKDFSKFPSYNGNIFHNKEELDHYFLDIYQYYTWGYWDENEGYINGSKIETMEGLYGMAMLLCYHEYETFLKYRTCVDYIQKGYFIYINSFDRDYDSELVEDMPVFDKENIILINKGEDG